MASTPLHDGVRGAATAASPVPLLPQTRDAGVSHKVLKRAKIVRILFVALAAALVGLHVWEPFAPLSVIGIVGVVVGGWPMFKEVAHSVIARRMTMELSMSIAIVAAAVIGQFFTALIITLFVAFILNSARLIPPIRHHTATPRGQPEPAHA